MVGTSSGTSSGASSSPPMPKYEKISVKAPAKSSAPWTDPVREYTMPKAVPAAATAANAVMAAQITLLDLRRRGCVTVYALLSLSS